MNTKGNELLFKAFSLWFHYDYADDNDDNEKEKQVNERTRQSQATFNFFMNAHLLACCTIHSTFEKLSPAASSNVLSPEVQRRKLQKNVPITTHTLCCSLREH